MLMLDLRRSILSMRLVIVAFIGLVILFLPAIYVFIDQEYWMWDSDIVHCYQDATGYGVYLFCAPALACLCGSNLYASDQANGFTSLVIARTTKARYVCSKFLCSGISGGLSLSLPVVLFSFIYICIHLNDLPNGEEMRSICVEVLLFIPYGFTWSVLGLGISFISKQDNAAYVSPYSISMFLKLSSSLLGIKWLSLNGLISPLNNMLKPLWGIFTYQSTIVISAVAMMIAGIRKWEN